MSHTAHYEVCIASASRDITEMVLNWMKEKGLAVKVEVNRYGMYVYLPQAQYYGIRVEIQNGKIHFSGEDSVINSNEFHKFQKMFTDVYTATVYRMALMQNGYKTEMMLSEKNGKKVIDIVGVQ